MFAIVQANGKYHGHVASEADAKDHVIKSKLENALLITDADYQLVSRGEADRVPVFAAGKPV